MITLHPPHVPGKRLPSMPKLSGGSDRASQPLRAVGPGRLERAYQSQVARLSRELNSVQEAQVGSDRELDMARLVERGTRRYVDRMEEQVQRREAKARRALVLVGTLQHDNQILQSKIQQLEGRLQRLAAPAAPGLVQRVCSRLGMGRS
ncbi:MAG: hypothetical protein P1V35_16005, partial [Planctomycetota bacterium]|nr:hypothetical protein [Planctomycetota bacterium]